jgi:hypothetical protein
MENPNGFDEFLESVRCAIVFCTKVGIC